MEAIYEKNRRGASIVQPQAIPADGATDIFDALLILQYAVGRDVERKQKL